MSSTQKVICYQYFIDSFNSSKPELQPHPHTLSSPMSVLKDIIRYFVWSIRRYCTWDITWDSRRYLANLIYFAFWWNFLVCHNCGNNYLGAERSEIIGSFSFVLFVRCFVTLCLWNKWQYVWNNCSLVTILISYVN